jgi:hypothetical protein
MFSGDLGLYEADLGHARPSWGHTGTILCKFEAILGHPGRLMAFLELLGSYWPS